MSTAATVAANKNVLDDLLQWSTKLPAWLRDALRRIVLNGDATPIDITELTTLCKAEHGLLDDDEASKPVPLNEKDVPTCSRSAVAVSIDAIENSQHVNALCNQQRLQFQSTGLNIVFGYNGSGKSGYGRVLKRACRSRSPGHPIKPNVLGTGGGPASALITVSHAGVQQPPEQWIDGIRNVDCLAAVSFFDGDCAQVHVESPNDIAFTPFGLDILPKLASASKAVQKALNVEQSALQAQTPKFLRDNKTRSETAVGKLLRSLSTTTDAGSLEQLTSISDGEVTRMKLLRTELASDPRKVAGEAKTRAERLRSLGTLLGKWQGKLDDAALASLRAAADNATTSSAAAELAAKGAFQEEPLPSVGGSEWRLLWEAARRYSTEAAYVGLVFPVVEDGSRCLLCQQELAPDARDRLTQFEAFVKDDTAQQARKAAAELAEVQLAITNAAAIDGRLKDLFGDVKLVNADLWNAARRLTAALIRRKRNALRACGEGNWETIKATHDTSALARLDGAATALQQEAAGIEEALDPAKRRELELELAELEDREWLSTVIGDVKDEIDRLVQLAAYRAAIESTKPTSITMKSKALAKERVTDRLRNAFAHELKRMHQGIRRVHVELAATSAEFGSSQYRIQLVGASSADVGGVVSEGEHRCIALAGFLAELVTEDSCSAIVFDDPVTSLDHLWRACFAARLVEEVALRQVIVFTHDIVFLHDLIELAEQQGAKLTLRRVQSQRDRCGLVSDDLPWIAQKTLSRIDELEKRARASEQAR